jgi:hypothetical protein
MSKVFTEIIYPTDSMVNSFTRNDSLGSKVYELIKKVIEKFVNENRAKNVKESKLELSVDINGVFVSKEFMSLNYPYGLLVTSEVFPSMMIVKIVSGNDEGRDVVSLDFMIR